MAVTQYYEVTDQDLGFTSLSNKAVQLPEHLLRGLDQGQAGGNTGHHLLRGVLDSVPSRPCVTNGRNEVPWRQARQIHLCGVPRPPSRTSL